MGLLSVFRQVRESAEAERKMRAMAEANQRKAAEMSTLDRYKLAAALDCDVDKITKDGRVIMDDPTPQQVAEWRSVAEIEAEIVSGMGSVDDRAERLSKLYREQGRSELECSYVYCKTFLTGADDIAGRPRALTPSEEFAGLQAQRKKERLTAAKAEVTSALYQGTSTWDERTAETATHAIENLIRTIMENEK